MKSLATILIALSLIACGIFPQEEKYVTDARINDNQTSDQQQLAYWRSYGF